MSLLSIWLCFFMLAAAGRILFYQREGARFRRHVSVLAWVVALCLFSSVIGLVLGWYRELPRGITLLLLLFCLRIWRDRGNVARLFGTGI